MLIVNSDNNKRGVTIDRDILRENIEEVLGEIYKLKLIERYLKFLTGEGAVLLCLAQNPEGMMPSKISELLQVSRARVTNIINALREKGLVELSHHPDDRRKMIVIMTEKGCDLISTKINQKISMFEYLFDKIGQEKMEALYDLLECALDTFKMLEEEGNCDE